MKHLPLATLCCVLSFASVSLVESQNDETTAAAYRLQAFAIDPFEEPIGDWVQNQDAKSLVIKRFGEPPSTEVSKRSDRTSDEILTEYVFDYDGLRFRIGESEVGDRSWVMVTEVTGDAHDLKFGLHIGSSRSEVIAAFRPDEYLVRGNTMRLSTNTVQDPPGQSEWHGGTITVIVYFESERVSKIRIMPSML